MPRLLVSVRNATEANHALQGGADLIDIKEPARGSLGQADALIIREIAVVVGAQRPLSAALGELIDTNCEPPPVDLSFVKWGLRGCGNVPNWPDLLVEREDAVKQVNPMCQAVAVIYADGGRVNAPGPTEVLKSASKIGCLVVLVDTCIKDGSNLLAWLDAAELREMRALTRDLGMQLALAGGIDFGLLPCVLEIEPDWIAIRGAACLDGREGTLCRDRVTQLAAVVHGT
jgi:(5-formylfuran-3-yl)methyl phosphate synthase